MKSSVTAAIASYPPSRSRSPHAGAFLAGGRVETAGVSPSSSLYGSPGPPGSRRL
jgi:hypothetical protein